MKVIHTSVLLGAALIAACSERRPVTAPAIDVAPIGQAAVIGDRPYTWNVMCSGDGWSNASWYWTAAGDTIAGTYMSFSCDPASSPIAGSGTRPATADGFSACVNGTSRTWAFDPTSTFSVKLNGNDSNVISYPFCWGHGHNGVCKDKLSWSATLTIDS